METAIIERWENGKENLRNYLATHPIKGNCLRYEELVKVLINECLNYECGYHFPFSSGFECIDDGDYQGTQIFVLHYSTYQPSATDYFIFDNSYGSCSGCDTLLSIIGCGSIDEPPTTGMVNELMTLCLHMVQRMKCLANLWKNENGQD
jgi:hypothetical protein